MLTVAPGGNNLATICYKDFLGLATINMYYYYYYYESMRCLPLELITVWADSLALKVIYQIECYFIIMKSCKLLPGYK